MTYIIVLKITKFDEDQLNCFWDIQQKSQGGGVNRVKIELIVLTIFRG